VHRAPLDDKNLCEQFNMEIIVSAKLGKTRYFVLFLKKQRFCARIGRIFCGGDTDFLAGASGAFVKFY
jgi:hypothetical protein